MDFSHGRLGGVSPFLLASPSFRTSLAASDLHPWPLMGHTGPTEVSEMWIRYQQTSNCKRSNQSINLKVFICRLPT